MEIRIQSIHFDADKKLLDLIQEKVNKLDLYYDSVIDGDVFLKLDKSSESCNKIVEIKINIPKQNAFFVKEQKKTFEEATYVAVEALARQLKKHKEKQLSHGAKKALESLDVELMEIERKV